MKSASPQAAKQELTIPGYWTVEELSRVTGRSNRMIRYDICGRPDRNQEPILAGYRLGPFWLIPDSAALPYIQKYSESAESPAA